MKNDRVMVHVGGDVAPQVGDLIDTAERPTTTYRVVRLLPYGYVIARAPRWHDPILLFVGRLTGWLPRGG